jgi:hypothetical protein
MIEIAGIEHPCHVCELRQLISICSDTLASNKPRKYYLDMYKRDRIRALNCNQSKWIVNHNHKGQ